MDPLHHLFHLSVIIALFSTGDLIKIMAFFPLLNEELYIGGNNWCSVLFPYPLKTSLFKYTEYICHLEMEHWKYLQCFICLFDFACIRLCILSILCMLPHSTYIYRVFNAFIFQFFYLLSTRFLVLFCLLLSFPFRFVLLFLVFPLAARKLSCFALYFPRHHLHFLQAHCLHESFISWSTSSCFIFSHPPGSNLLFVPGLALKGC